MKPDRAGQLFDLLVSHPERVTLKQILTELGCNRMVAKRTIRELRLLLEDDTITVVCDPDPDHPRGGWLYGLVGTVEQAKAWQTRRLLSTETQLETQRAVARSMVKATDGRSRDGRRARLITKALGRLLEDLHDLDESIPSN